MLCFLCFSLHNFCGEKAVLSFQEYEDEIFLLQTVISTVATRQKVLGPQFHHLAGALCEVCMGSLQVHQLPHWIISYVLLKLLQVPLTVANNSQTTAHTLQSRCACLATRQHFLLIVCCVVCMFRSTAALSTLYHRYFDWSHHQQQRWNINNNYTFV